MLASIRWPLALGAAVGAHVVLIAATVAWVALFAYVGHPGETESFYQQHAEQAAPVIAIVGGIPVFLAAGRYMGMAHREVAAATAWAAWAGYVAFELPMFFAGVDLAAFLPAWAASVATKLVAVHAGVKVGRQAG